MIKLNKRFVDFGLCCGLFLNTPKWWGVSADGSCRYLSKQSIRKLTTSSCLKKSRGILKRVYFFDSSKAFKLLGVCATSPDSLNLGGYVDADNESD